MNIMLLELDLRMLLYFFQKIIGYVKIMFELLYIFTKLIHFPHIVWLCDFFADYAIRCGKRSIVQIAPAHNIRIPVLELIPIWSMLNQNNYLKSSVQKRPKWRFSVTFYNTGKFGVFFTVALYSRLMVHSK